MVTFDEIKSGFWGPGGHGVQSPLTDEMVREAEDILGVTLPGELLELLRIQNGGVAAKGNCIFPTAVATSWAEGHIPFADLMGIGRTDGSLSLLNTPYLVEEWDLPEPLVLLSGDGHYWIGLDYRKVGPADEPEVTWFDTDSAEHVVVAPTFRSFVEGLGGEHGES